MKLESASFDELTVFHEPPRSAPAQAPPGNSLQHSLLRVFQFSGGFGSNWKNGMVYQEINAVVDACF